MAPKKSKKRNKATHYPDVDIIPNGSQKGGVVDVVSGKKGLISSGSNSDLIKIGKPVSHSRKKTKRSRR